MSLTLSGLSAGYGGSQVLRDVTLTVPQGALVALLGPNGAGKTTLLRAASGLLPLAAGAIDVDGTAYGGRPPHAFARAGVCHVPEGRGIFPSLTVRENILAQAPKQRATEALELAIDAFPRLGQRLGQVAGTMSGGEQQMLALSRAYVTRPAYVLLDEVSLGLAPKVVDEIFAFLRRLAGAGCSLLLVEQYVSRALEAADLVYILKRGRVSFAGEPAEVDEEELFRSYTGAS